MRVLSGVVTTCRCNLILKRQRVQTVSMVSPFILVSLVLSLVCVSRVLAALECPETAGSGPSYELVPVSPSDSGHMLMTASADEARNTAVCHATCVNYIFESQVGSPNGSNATNGTAPTDGTALNVGSEVCAICLFSLLSLLLLCVCLTGCLQAQLQTIQTGQLWGP